MNTILTYQDYKEAVDKESFYLNAIEEYQSSDLYRQAIISDAYYRRDNQAIKSRGNLIDEFLKAKKVKGVSSKDFKLASGFMKKTVKQATSYLVGNGVTLDTNLKEQVGGSKFDKGLKLAVETAQIMSVCYGFYSIDKSKLLIFTPLEYFPLLDENNGDMKLGIRFWQLGDDDTKPLNVEVFTCKSVTHYIKDHDKLVFKSENPIKAKVQESAVETEVIDIDAFPQVPVYPLYMNAEKTGVLDYGLRESIDAYDFVSSDLINGIIQLEGIILTLNNFQGQEVEEAISAFKELKAVLSDHDGADIDAKSIEIPYNAKKTALELIEKKMYKDTMTLNTEELTGGNLTNVAIKVAMTDLDLKVDDMEFELIEFIQHIFKFLGYEQVEPQFKRRTIINDNETVSNLSTMLSDGYIDNEFAINHNPLIPDEDKEPLFKRVAEQEQSLAESKFPLENNAEPVEGEPITAGEVKEIAKQETGKGLNGAQTQSLIGIMTQYSQGLITEGKAINLISVAIGISKEDAKNILNGVE